MTYSPKALELIANFEGTRLKPYNCPANHATIGTGHLIHRGPYTPEDCAKYANFTQDDAYSLLLVDANQTFEQIKPLVKVPLNANQYGALVSFVFNEGIGNFASSTLLKVINSGDFSDVGRQFNRWVYAIVNGANVQLPGLVSRRAAEFALWSEQA